MPSPKVTPELATFVHEKSRAGFSLREIVNWLSAAHGVAVTPQTIKNVLDRRARAPNAAPAQPPGVGPAIGGGALAAAPGTCIPESDDGSCEGNSRELPPVGDAGPDGEDLATLNKAIAEIAGDVEKARTNGASQALATLQRLHLDALDRRRKLRPPAPPPDTDAEALAAGAKAVERLRKLVAVERERAAELGFAK